MREFLIDIFVYANPTPYPNGKAYPFRVEATAGKMNVCPVFYERNEDDIAARVRWIRDKCSKPGDSFQIVRRERKR